MIYRAQGGFVNFGSVSHSKVDLNEEDLSRVGKADEEVRCCGASYQNSYNLTEREHDIAAIQKRSVFSNINPSHKQVTRCRVNQHLYATSSIAEGMAASITQTQRVAQTILHNLRVESVLKDLSDCRRKISILSVNELRKTLDIVMQEIVRSDRPIKAMERLAKILPLDRLQKVVQIDHPQHINALQTAKEMLLEAQYVLRAMDGPPLPTLRLRLSAIADSLISIIECVLSGFGIAEFFKPADSPVTANFKSQQIIMLLQLSAMLVPIMGTVIGGAAIGCSLLAIAGLSVIYPYIRPVPSCLPKGINWTKQYNQGQLLAAQGRKKILDELARTLLIGTKVKTHPLLIGQSGIGKTEAVKAFVQAIERGDYPELKGKQVFYFNTADLVKSSELFQDENKILSNINEEIGRHRNNIILIFDEIHLACQKDQSVFGEQLKTMLDPGSSNLPYVIGITTEEEYYRDIHMANTAFARRFKRINVDNPDPSEVLTILTNTFLQKAPELILEQDILKTLQEKVKKAFSNNVPEPMTSLKILSLCIQRAAESQSSSLEAKVERMRTQIQSLLAQDGAGQGNAFLPYQHRKRIQKLRSNLQKLEQLSNQKQQELSRFFQLRKNLSESKKTAFRIVIKVANLQQDGLSTDDRNTLTFFLLLSHFLAPAQEKLVRKEAARLEVKTEINLALVDQIIQEELDNEKNANRAIERGKQQIQARSSG